MCGLPRETVLTMFSSTLIVSHGARSLVYSLVEDSMRKAYFPLDSRTLMMPSLVEVARTWGREDMNSHMRE